MNKFDMHFHSTISDWKNTPGEIIKKAKNIWLWMITLTDHDMISDDKFIDDANEAWIITNKSVEISSRNYESGKSLHLTCYAKSFSLRTYDILNNTKLWKIEMIKAQILKLKEKWFDIDYDIFCEYVKIKWKDLESVNKFNVSEYLFLNPKNKLLALNIYWKEISEVDFFLIFMKEWWEYHWEYWIKVSDYEPSIEIAWQLATSNNAILSIAHPNFSFSKVWISWFHKVIPEYVDKWINAIEINSKASKKWIEAIYQIKKRYNLLLTAWSDNHQIWFTDDKHSDFWELNPLLSDEKKIEIFNEYCEYLTLKI